MFILGWVVLQIMKANAVVVPDVAVWIVTGLAALEALAYVIAIVVNVYMWIKIKRDF